MYEAFVVWATEVMDMFSSIFTRHVFTSKDQQSAAECLEIAHQHCLIVCISSSHFFSHINCTKFPLLFFLFII